MYDGGHGYASNVTASDELVWAFIAAAFHDTAWPPPSSSSASSSSSSSSSSSAAAAPTASVSVVDVSPAAVSVVAAPAAVATAAVAATPLAAVPAADAAAHAAHTVRPLPDPRVASQTPLLEALAAVEARPASPPRGGVMLEPNAPTGLPRAHPLL